MHRLIMKAVEGEEVHHVSEDVLDNRRENLRRLPITVHRTHHGHVSGPITGKYKGVYWAKRESRWIAKIKHQGRSIFIGSFNSADDAAKAYDRKAIDLFGEDCYLNLPEKGKHNVNDSSQVY